MHLTIANCAIPGESRVTDTFERPFSVLAGCIGGTVVCFQSAFVLIWKTNSKSQMVDYSGLKKNGRIQKGTKKSSEGNQEDKKFTHTYTHSLPLSFPQTRIHFPCACKTMRQIQRSNALRPTTSTQTPAFSVIIIQSDTFFWPSVLASLHCKPEKSLGG